MPFHKKDRSRRAGGEDGGAANPPERPRESVLIVDDEQPVVDILREYFQDRFEVRTAATGAEAIEHVRTREPGVVLLDISMPGMSGIEALRRIKATNEAIPVIMLTANADNAVAVEAIEAGALSYAPKPLNFTYLEHLVSVALEQRRRDPRRRI